MFLFSRFCVGWIKFINPKGEDAKACKSFAKAIIIFLFIAVLNVLNKSGLVTYDLYAFGFANITLIICFYFVITYLNNSPEPTTFMVKLVGVSLVTVLLVLGFVGNITLSLSEEEYDTQKRAEILGSKPFILNKQYDQIAEDIEYIIRKPVDADPFNENLKIEFNRHPDQLNIDKVLSEQKKSEISLSRNY